MTRTSHELKNIWSKEVFAKNLAYYIAASGKTQKEVADYLGVSAPTMSDWANGKKFPRIDKIEMLADYFNILKSDLIEDKTELKKSNEAIAGIIARMRVDSEFLSLVQDLMQLDSNQVQSVQALLQAFLKK